ncbi:MAG TPA: universal stress protein UspA [Gammaproteobacteria bacterium]|jgi:nucleotide-binding universal stress UspA family protein|nr:universal stress protein UspA [Gammaproteobacteria bacterium]
MSESTQEYVVACVDGATYTDAVTDYAAWSAQRMGQPLKLLHNVEHREVASHDLSGAIGLGAQESLMQELVDVEQKRSKILLEHGKHILNRQRDRLAEHGHPEPVLRQRHGPLTETLVDCEHEIHLLVMGIRGEQTEGNELGAHLETVARSLHKPILVVNKPFTEPRSIMLAYDGSEHSKKALNMVAQLPLFRDIPCHVAGVGKLTGIQSALSAAADVLQSAGIETTIAALTGDPQAALVEYRRGNDIDLTVMGAFSHHRIRDLFVGSFTAKMMLSTQKPLLLLR